ncbi:MAG TPA: YlmH/Sll1252 family protein [Pseudogracilibacillus sp.]|nr:YlmH/Sll1252 family protein [Pseudogracilibacillus sp.]
MSIYQHYRQEEHSFVDQVLTWKEQVETYYTAQLTDFLDPRERQIVKSVIGEANEEIRISFYGGDKEAERKRVLIKPYYEETTINDYEIILFQASFPKKFINIQHGDVMGAFLGLGLERKKMGDIIVNDDQLQIYTTKDVAMYVQTNLIAINRANVQLQEVKLNQKLERNEIWKEQTHSVSSMRLDVLIKEIYRMSRSKAAELITRKQVKVNFKIVNDPAMLILEADLISVKGYGRSRVLELGGLSRKQRTFVTTAVLKT